MFCDTKTLSAFLFALISCVLCDDIVRWCTVSDNEQSKCEAMATAFSNNQLSPKVRCEQADDRYACMRMISAGDADAMRLDDTDIYTAGKLYDLRPVMKEAYTSDPNAGTFIYKGVAVVKKVGPIQSIKDLAGSRSCHTGVGRTVGWTIPVSNLMAMGVMETKDCYNTVKNVAGFFSKSCAAGAFDGVNNPSGDNPLNICEQCLNERCTSSDEYSGYNGALKCLIDGRGDVAFVKHSTIDEYVQSSSGGQGLGFSKDDYKLLCPDGSLKHPNSWDECYWGTRPTDAIVTSSSKSEEYKSSLKHMLESAVMQFGVDSTTFRMFSSAGYPDSKNLIFSDDTKKLVSLDNDMTYRQYFDNGYLNTMENYTTCGEKIRWCVLSDAELSKCRDLSAAFMSKRLSNGIMCTKAKDVSECMTKIRDGSIDIMNGDGGDIFTGGKYYNLVPIIAESYKVTSEGTSYWAVAVAKKSNKDVNMNNLKGKTSCHTGIQKTSGWNIPVGLLVETGQINIGSDCEIVESVGSFFSKSCVPGALNPKYNPSGKNPENLCALCGGADSCQRDKSNKYYDYKGAFRCLVEKNADVAFVKHSTALEFTNGESTDDWARDLKSKDFELLCKDGTRKRVADYQDCHLARVPAHALVVGHHMPEFNRSLIWNILNAAQENFRKDPNAFKMFYSGTLGSDLLFKDQTSKLEKITLKKQYYENWLGKDYIDAMKGIDIHQCLVAHANAVTYAISTILMAIVALLLSSNFS